MSRLYSFIMSSEKHSLLACSVRLSLVSNDYRIINDIGPYTRDAYHLGGDNLL